MPELLTKKEILEKFGISRISLYHFLRNGLPYTVMEDGEIMYDVKIIKAMSKNFKNIYIDDEFDVNEICEIFNLKYLYRINRSSMAGSIIIVSNYKDEDDFYSDYWEKNIFHFTGCGDEGDQKLKFSYNKMLANSVEKNMDIYLFEGNINGKYIFKGYLKLEDDPYMCDGFDKNNNIRKVCKFPLKLINNELIGSKKYIIKTRKEVYRVNNNKLRKKLVKRGQNNTSKKISSVTFERSKDVREYSIRRANGYCQLCKEKGPFIYEGKPYLESHHIKWLSEGGEDSIENTCGLCPNCHEKVHKLPNIKNDDIIREQIRIDEIEMNS